MKVNDDMPEGPADGAPVLAATDEPPVPAAAAELEVKARPVEATPVTEEMAP